MISPLPVVQPIFTCLWARLFKVWSSVRVVHLVLPPVAAGPSRVHSPALKLEPSNSHMPGFRQKLASVCVISLMALCALLLRTQSLLSSSRSANFDPDNPSKDSTAVFEKYSPDLFGVIILTLCCLAFPFVFAVGLYLCVNSTGLQEKWEFCVALGFSIFPFELASAAIDPLPFSPACKPSRAHRSVEVLSACRGCAGLK